MTDCAQSSHLSAFIDDELSPKERDELKAHLEQCAGCQQELRAMQALRSNLYALPADEFARKRILDSITASTPWWRWQVRVSSVAVASVLLLFTLSLAANFYFASRHMVDEPTQPQQFSDVPAELPSVQVYTRPQERAPQYLISAKTPFRLKEKPVIHVGSIVTE